MDDTTKYVLFGLAILLTIIMPGIIRFCCIERCNRNQTQTNIQTNIQDNIQQFHTQAKYVQI